MFKKFLFVLLCVTSSAASAESTESAESTASTYSPGNFGFQAGVGTVKAKGALWSGEQSQAFRFGIDLVSLKAGIVSLGTRWEFTNFKTPYEFSATEKKDAKLSLHTLRVQSCFKVWDMHHPCVSLLPTNATIASGSNQRTMGLNGVGLGWETNFDNGMYLRADGESMQAAERSAGKRMLTTMTAAWLSVGAKITKD